MEMMRADVVGHQTFSFPVEKPGIIPIYLMFSLLESPEVELQVFDDISVMGGNTITLSCDAVSYPPPLVTWRRNLMPIPKLSRYNFTSQNGFGVLRISDSGLEDAGQYHCEVSSAVHGSQLIQPSIQVQVADGENKNSTIPLLGQSHTS